MKKLLPLITLLLLLWLQSTAQNLVPNPSFEDTVMCPDNYYQIDRATGWIAVRSSPDYFHSCSNLMSVPQNPVGYQNPIGYVCNAYAGFHPGLAGFSYREYLGSFLLSPLTPGTKYFVSMDVSLGEFSNYALNKLGVLFSNIAPIDSFGLNPIKNFAHVYTNTIITDTMNWTKIVGSFISDSAYTFINIGNFFDDNHIDTIQFLPGTFVYYYVDNICVSTDSNTCNQILEPCTVSMNEKIPSKIFNTYPNPFKQATTIYINEVVQQTIDVIMYDLFGRNVTTQILYTVEDGHDGMTLKISRNILKNGIYILKISTRNKIYIYKLIIN